MKRPNEMVCALWFLMAFLSILVYFGRGPNWNFETWATASALFATMGMVGAIAFWDF